MTDLQKLPKYSFLKWLFGSAYNDISDFATYIKYYLIGVALLVFLSLFIYSGVINFFIQALLGWTIFAIPVVFQGIVYCDIPYTLDSEEAQKWETSGIKPKPRTISTIYGCFLILVGLSFLFICNRYASSYSFKSHKFYVGADKNYYHYIDNRDCIPFNHRIKDHVVRGKYIIDHGIKLCPRCREWEEDMEIMSETTYVHR